MKKILIAGVDEVGRGSWAGPLVAAAVVFVKPLNFKLADSKKLNSKQRKVLVTKIKERAHYSVAEVSVKEINKIGLQAANILAARRAIDKLSIKPTYIKLDMIRGFSHNIKYELIIKGDEKVKQISAASIIAKEYRDNLMIKLHKKHSSYGFDTNVGYGTKKHQAGLEKNGPCIIHRINYRPIKKYYISSTKE